MIPTETPATVAAVATITASQANDEILNKSKNQRQNRVHVQQILVLLILFTIRWHWRIISDEHSTHVSLILYVMCLYSIKLYSISLEY